MRHFFVKPDQIKDGLASITGADVNHIVHVLRMRPGEQVEVNDGTKTYVCDLLELSEEQVTAKILSETESTELPVFVTLYQGLPKSDKMETILQKCTELGVSCVVPVAMKRCVAKLDDAKKQETKVRRWSAIAEAAAKQSRRTKIPEVHQVVTYKTMLAELAGFDAVLLPYEDARGMEHTRQVLGGLKPGASVAVIIGPEGGFEETEVLTAKEAGAQIITLGRRILRTETAGPAVLSMIGFCLEP